MRTVREGSGRADSGLVAGLGAVGWAVAGDTGAAPVVLSDRPDGVVVRVGEVVVKAHATGTDAAALGVRCRVAGHPRLAGVLLPSLPVPPPVGQPDGLARVGEWLATAWPAGVPVDPDEPDAAPWEQAARLLARLHATPVAAVAGAGGLPAAGGPGLVVRGIERLRAAGAPSPAAAVVLEAFATLPPWLCEGRPAAAGRGPREGGSGGLVHGDWHLGQLVSWRGGARGGDGWRLIDVDDLGTGDPVWDLARPAAWFATGMLPPEVWERFLAAYRAAGGCAVPPDGDPWAVLDLPARALTVQSAALRVAAAARAGDGAGRPLDEDEDALVAACARIVTVRGERVVS